MSGTLSELKTLCACIESADNVHSDELAHEVSVVNAFISAMESDEDILVDGEPAEAEDVEDRNIALAVQRLKRIARGEGAPEGPYPLQDDICHHPGCDYEHGH